MLVGYISFALAVVGAIAGIALGVHHAIDQHQEKAYRRRTGR